MKFVITLFLMMFVGLPSAFGALVFTEDFEGGLGGWTGKGGGANNGAIVAAPLDADNALNFTALNSAGDVFSMAVVGPAGKYVLSFDYLGLAAPGSVPGNLGGFIGISQELPGTHRWLQGTALIGGTEDNALIDDDTWRHYDVMFTTAYPFHVMIEDFSGSGGVAGDAYFDNISVSSIPEPATLFLFSAAIVGLGLFGWRRQWAAR